MYRDIAAGVYLSEAQNPIPVPPYTCTVYVTQGKGEGLELNQREGERSSRGGYRSQSWVENTNITECTQEIRYNIQSKNSYRSILDDDILHWLL